MALTSLVRSEFSVELEVDGITDRFQVANFESHWGMNEIPIATCALGIGREAEDGLVTAKIHSNITEFKIMRKAKVFFTPFGDWDDGVPWPGGEQLVFEGRITGTGFQKQDGSVQFVVHMIHWLSDLDFSSALTTRSHPTNPAQYTFPALVEPLVGTPGLTNTGVTVGGGIGQTAEADSIADPDKIKEDLWGQAIKPLLCALAQEDTVLFSAELTDCVEEFDADPSPLEALGRIESVETGGVVDALCDLERSCYTPPLALLLGNSGSPESVANAISEALMRQSIESYNNTTLWGKIVGQFAPGFAFALVPQVTKALIVPAIVGLRGTYCKKIESSDYTSISLSGQLTRPLKAIAIHGGVSTNTGVPNSGDPLDSAGLASGILGCFAPKDVKQGMILFEQAPLWLAGVPASGHSTSRSTGLKASKPTGSATTPAEDDEELIANEDGKTQEELLKGETALYNGWAHTMYVTRQLHGRSGNLFGKLRFDIAPGSNIIVEGSSERFIQGDQSAETLFATVSRVSIKLNAEAGQAGTGFSLIGVRTEEENKDDKTSVEKHPLYETTFTGAPLIDEYQFDEGECC